eukprot:CAMPEP_0176117246 /NCGR_PEP_ID=MMETSP0120_2-20121206/58899_1 /TAXON_ID=160619 /ORGANISM="Kryptoperidinium foliaceum, Strain CCMP 1326" /LENGTH=65 /DNA_ID=CAMNT_0017451531 /DNA_START=85 /DNA_END=280 /DNA_ORIENTATION=+
MCACSVAESDVGTRCTAPTADGLNMEPLQAKAASITGFRADVPAGYECGGGGRPGTAQRELTGMK